MSTLTTFGFGRLFADGVQIGTTKGACFEMAPPRKTFFPPTGPFELTGSIRVRYSKSGVRPRGVPRRKWWSHSRTERRCLGGLLGLV